MNSLSFYIDCCRIIFRRNKLFYYKRILSIKNKDFLFLTFRWNVYFSCIFSLTYFKCAECIAIRNRFYLKVCISQCFVYELNKGDTFEEGNIHYTSICEKSHIPAAGKLLLSV